MKTIYLICCYCLISTFCLQAQESDLMEEHAEELIASPVQKKKVKQEKISIRRLMITEEEQSLIIESFNQCHKCGRMNCRKSTKWGIHLWDMQHNEQVPVTEMIQPKLATNIDIAVDKNYVAYYRNYQLHFWDIQQRKKGHVSKKEGTENYMITTGFDSPYFFGSTHNGRLFKWNTTTQQKEDIAQGYSGAVSHVAVSPNLQYIAGCCDRTSLKLWSAETGELIKSFDDHHANFINEIVFSADNEYMVSCSDDNSVKLWGIPYPRLIHNFTGHKEDVTTVAMTSDNQYIVSGCIDHTINLWDVPQKRLVHTFKGHQERINQVVVTADNRRLLSCSDDGTVKIWDLAKRELLATLFSFDYGQEWIALTPKGRYTGTSKGLKDYIYYVDGLTNKALEMNKDVEHIPDLLMQLLAPSSMD